MFDPRERTIRLGVLSFCWRLRYKRFSNTVIAPAVRSTNIIVMKNALKKTPPPPYKLSGDNIKRISIIGFSFLVSGKNFNTFQRGGGICGLAIIYKYIPLNPTGSMYMSAYSLPVILFCSSNPITTTLGGLLFQQGGYVCIFSVLYLRLIFISLILNCNSSWWPAVPTGRLCR